MESLLVAGADTMVGANFAAQLAEQFHVTAGSFQAPRDILGCQSMSLASVSPEALLKELQPHRLVYCGAGANSAWEATACPTSKDVERAEDWLRGARAANVAVTLISSDAVFTGPWMFHAENSKSVCPSPEATCLRRIEQFAQDTLPECLIVRTHAFGWSSCWLETLLVEMAAGRCGPLDCVRHASPILVNDLIDAVVKSWNAGLAGVYHVAGAERTNPAAFAQRLAAEFGCRIPRQTATESLIQRSNGFGCSETSLQTRKVRRALGVSMPLLGEGLRRLRQLSVNGYRDRLAPAARTTPPARVA